MGQCWTVLNKTHCLIFVLQDKDELHYRLTFTEPSHTALVKLYDQTNTSLKALYSSIFTAAQQNPQMPKKTSVSQKHFSIISFKISELLPSGADSLQD